MAEICKSRHIKMILITTPTMPRYYNNLNHVKRNVMKLQNEMCIHDKQNEMCI